MAMYEYDDLKNLDVITQDAYILGEILDVRYEDLTWNIKGLKVKSQSKVSKMINVGSGKSMLLLQPGKYAINDVLVLPDAIDGVMMRVTADNNNFKSLADTLGMKVMSSENVLIGYVDSIQMDLESWKLISMKVKLDKNAYAPLDIKKGLLGKKVSGLLMTDISEVSDVIKLSLNITEVKSQVIVD